MKQFIGWIFICASCLLFSGCLGLIRTILFPEQAAIAAGTSAAQSVTQSILDDPDLVGAMESQAVQDLDRIVSDNPGASNADTINDANSYLREHIPRDRQGQGYGGASPLQSRGAFSEEHWDHQTDLKSLKRSDDRLQAAIAGRHVNSHIQRKHAHVLWSPNSLSAFDEPIDGPIQSEPQRARRVNREQSLYHLQAGRE